MLVVEKEVDANWFKGSIGDQQGIFPVAYVEMI